MIKKILAAALMIGALAGCSTSKVIVSDVTRFHTMAAPSEFQGRTFSIAAIEPDQQQSIAFRSFADKINAELSVLGMKQYTGNDGPAGADYVINLHYGVTGPTADVRAEWMGGPSWYGPHAGFGYGFWGRHSAFAFNYGYDPFWDDRYYVSTRQTFVRRVELDIYRGETYASNNKQRVFEGRAISAGLNGQIEPVMPYMLDAIFRDFPGPSGKTMTVRVEVPPDVERNTAATARSTY